MTTQVNLTADLLLRAYASGIFPMAESADDPDIHWVDPSRRGIIPLDGLHISRSMRREIRAARFTPTFNSDFCAVVQACANRPETWINQIISDLYKELHQKGYAISQEIWEGSELVGGVYGVVIGGAFFGESMFSTRTNASKLALIYLVDRLRISGIELFDTQFITPHLASMGAIEISRSDYLDRLQNAVDKHVHVTEDGLDQSPSAILQRMGQTS